ncbi:hypothetical protein [Actinomycetospora lemnae]|uniref:Hpt domain-containing protein n=1 Tax=Actinomycetospora lemnae TaxID=3019891 RepID=A0ABT5SUN9_9PSEU|nr:hypothetical protein [Actinomycetospora sp. DW7H6]MDD7966170.1 hypothetical protein [Actinomycetospora sp. DW7H6]
MATHNTSSRPLDDLEVDTTATPRDAVAQLFAAALDGDRRAEATLHLLGGFDETAQRASAALLDSGSDPRHGTVDVLASIDRTLAALRDERR